MFGIGIMELLLILIAAMIFIGPDKIPEIAKAFGRTYAEFKRITDGLKKDITGQVTEPEGSGTKTAGVSSEHAGDDRKKRLESRG